MRLRLAAALVLCGLALASVEQARAQDFYRGKTLTIVVGFSPGGGFDLVARIVARHLGAHIPGHPTVVVQNMPGAASLTSVLNLDKGEPKDGTVVDTFNFGQITASRLEPKKVPVDFRNYSWLGSVSEDATVCYVWHTLGVKNLAQLQKHGLIHTGLTSIGSSSDLNQRILKYIFKVDLQQVPGYPGSAEERLGIERGELDGDCGAWSSLPANWISGHLIQPVLKSTANPQPDLPADVPYAVDAAPTPKDREIVRFLLASGQLERPYILSRSVPADRLAILQKAFDATMRDPAFKAELKQHRLPYEPKNAQQSLAVLNSIYSAPKKVVDEARAIVLR